MRRVGSLTLVAVAMLLATGCGSSTQDDAKDKACDAKSDIKSQISTIKSLPLEAASVDKLKSSLASIKSDLDTISKEAPKADDDLEKQLKSANAEFKDQVRNTIDSIDSADSLATAAAAIALSASDLESSYRKAFDEVKC